jgi:O-antigen/teichoic acid export membrane protein
MKGKSTQQAIRNLLNSGLITLAEYARPATYFVFFILVARRFGGQELGKLLIALTFSNFAFVFVRFGFDFLIAREVAKNRGVVAQYLGSSIVAMLVLWGICFIITLVILPWLGYDVSVATIIKLLIISLVFRLVTEALNACYQGYERMDYTAFVAIVSSIILIVGAIVVTSFGNDMVALAWLMLIESILTMTMSLILAKNIAHPLFLFPIDLKLTWKLFRACLPFFWVALAGLAHQRGDILILSKMTSELQVGLYGAAYRLLEGLAVFPAAIAKLFLPVMSRSYQQGEQSFLSIYGQALRYLLIVLFPVTVGVFFLSKKLMILFFGSEFGPSAAVLQILIWILVLQGITNTTGRGIMAMGKERYFYWMGIVVVPTNIVINIILIPRFGIIGSAVASLFSFSLSALISVGVMRLNHCYANFRPILGSLMAAAVMGGMAFALEGLSLGVIIPVAAVVYLMFLVLFGGLTVEDLSLAKQVVVLFQERHFLKSRQQH